MSHVSKWYKEATPLKKFNWNYKLTTKNKLWKPGRAGVLTAGGNCPGINYTIHELAKRTNQELVYFKDGYKGLNQDKTLEYINTLVTKNENGSILGMSREKVVPENAIDTCLKNNITNLYLIGGNGTCNGAYMLQKYIEVNEVPLVVNVIPKTIDNDIYLVKKSFGFDTSVNHCKNIIEMAYIEAKTNSEISIVEIMGNKCGKLALYSSYVSDKVDLLLIPENEKITYAEILDKIEYIYDKKKHMVIVLAEGFEIKERDNIKSTKKIEKGIKRLGISEKPKVFKPNYICRNGELVTSDKIFIKQLVHHIVDITEQGYGGYTISQEGNHFFIIPLNRIFNREGKISKDDYIYREYYMNSR